MAMSIATIWKSIMIFCGIFFGIMVCMYAGFKEYGVETDDEFNATFYEIERAMNETGVLGSDLAGKVEAGKSEEQTNYFILRPKVIWRVLISPFTSMRTVTRVINVLLNYLPIPHWVIWFTISFMTGCIVFIIIGAAQRHKL